PLRPAPSQGPPPPLRPPPLRRALPWPPPAPSLRPPPALRPAPARAGGSRSGGWPMRWRDQSNRARYRSNRAGDRRRARSQRLRSFGWSPQVGASSAVVLELERHGFVELPQPRDDSL